MTNLHVKKTYPLLGIALVIASVACFVVVDTTVKVISVSFSILMAVWFRYLCQAVGMTLLILPRWRSTRLTTRRPWAHFMRGALMLSSSALSFVALTYMPVAELTAIWMLTPLMATFLSVVFLGERVNGLRWLLVAGGFLGAMLVIRPGGADLDLSILLALGGMLLYSVFLILTGHMASTEAPMVMHMSSGWVGALMMSAALPWIWQGIPSSDMGALLLLAGVAGTVGHYLLIVAYSHAPTGVIAPYMYLQIAFALVAGWLIFDYMPGALELAGMALIVVSGALAAWLAARTDEPPTRTPQRPTGGVPAPSTRPDPTAP